MCSKEDVQLIVDATEKRMEAKITECITDVDSRIEGLNDKLYGSHAAINAVQSEMGATLIRLADKLEDFGQRFAAHDKKEIEYQNKVDAHLELQSSFSKLTSDDVQALKDIAQGYAGMSAMRKLILGLASTIIAIGAVVAGFITLIKSIK